MLMSKEMPYAAKPAESRFSAKDLAYIAIMTVLITVCSWIHIPSAVPFTLQTFGVFCSLGILGGRRGFFSVLVYLLLGTAGVPVFAEFYGGIGTFLAPSGGYLIGFLATAAVYWLITRFFGEKTLTKVIAMTAGLIICYAVGTLWFMAVYSHNVESIGFVTALLWCVVPYIIPDVVKMALAVILSERLSKYVRN